MYQVTRKNKVKESLRFNHADGTEAFTAEVEINVDEFAGKYNKARELAAFAENKLKNSPESEELQQAYGEAVIAVLELIFGQENTRKILEFYENRYSEMLLDIYPFLTEVIQPAIQEAARDRAEKLSSALKYAKGRKAKRQLS